MKITVRWSGSMIRDDKDPRIFVDALQQGSYGLICANIRFLDDRAVHVCFSISLIFRFHEAPKVMLNQIQHPENDNEQIPVLTSNQVYCRFQCLLVNAPYLSKI